MFVPGFAIDTYNVMNRDFMLFMQAGGYQNRSLWSDEAWEWKNAEDVRIRRSGGAKEICGCIARCLATSSCRWIGRCM